MLRNLGSHTPKKSNVYEDGNRAREIVSLKYGKCFLKSGEQDFFFFYKQLRYALLYLFTLF